MNQETREQIALARYKLISPVLAEPGRVQNEYFRGQAEKEHELPHYGCRRLSVSTLKLWLRRYREKGFEGLKPRARADQGRPRRLGEQSLAAIRGKCKAYPRWSVQMLYEDLLASEQLGDPPVCYNTLLRAIAREGLLPKAGRRDVRKRFEHEEVNELWVGDFLHGPTVMAHNRLAKAILCALIDDHSRMIVGYQFSVHETVSVLVEVLKEAFSTYGLSQRLYVDNGSAFSSDLLAKSCAQAGVSLIHSKPYDSPSRGKIERFFRTVRERFFSGLRASLTLEELNQAFSAWLREDYHYKVHTGIEQRPIDRYQASVTRVSIRRLSKAELDEIFLVRHERIVANDATISFKGRIYEVPGAYIRQRIEIRHPVDDEGALTLYDNGARIARLKLVDVRENARTFRPASAPTPVSYSRGKVQR
jgi:transposase InsO family protein